jgi:hypothetical protein
MKRYIIFSGLMFLATSAFGQFQAQLDQQQNSSPAIVRPISPLSDIGSLFDPNKFSMRQNAGISFMSGGGQSVSLAQFTNSMMYQIADPLTVRLDLTLQGAPYNGLSGVSSSDLNKLFISNAELNYKLSDNSALKLQFTQAPYSSWGLSDPYGYNRMSLFRGDQ